jgi:hypothetical protein
MSCGAKRNSSQNNMGGGQSPHPVNTDQFGEYFKEILSVVIGLLTKPASTIKNAVISFKKESSFILAGIMVIVQSLLSLWSIRQVMGGVLNVLGNIAGMFGGILGGNNLSYGKVFATSLFSTIIILAALSGIIYLIGKYVFKGQGSFISIWKVVVCAYVPYVIAGLAGIILGYISAAICQAVMIAGMLIFILLLFIGTMDAMKVGDDKAIYIFTTSVAVIFLILFIILRIYITSKMRSISF